MSKLAFRAQTVDIAYLPLRQDLLPKTVLMTTQRDFHLSNRLSYTAIFLGKQRESVCLTGFRQGFPNVGIVSPVTFWFEYTPKALTPGCRHPFSVRALHGFQRRHVFGAVSFQDLKPSKLHTSASLLDVVWIVDSIILYLSDR